MTLRRLLTVECDRCLLSIPTDRTTAASARRVAAAAGWSHQAPGFAQPSADFCSNCSRHLSPPEVAEQVQT